MYIRYNSTIKFWEYDTSAAQNGTGPWILLPVDPAKLTGTFPAPAAHHVTHETGGTDKIVSLDGSVINSGTVVDARLSANVPLLNKSNLFTATPQVIAGDSTHTPGFELSDSSSGVYLRLINYISRFHVYYNPFGSLFQVDLTGALYERARAAPIGGWQNWTVTWSSYSGAAPVLGNGTITGRYSMVGKICFYTIRFNYGSTSTPGGNFWAFSLPVNAISADISGSMTFRRGADGAAVFGQAIAGAYYFGISNSVGGLTHPVGGGADSFLGVGMPFNWSSGDQIWMNGFFEMA